MNDSNRSVPIETLLAERDWVRWLARTLVADPNRADDLEQQTWLAAVERPPASGGSVRGWLATVLRRAASKGRRSSERSERRDQEAARPEGERSTAEVVAEAELHHRVVRAVLDLEEPYRSTILLRFFENLPPRDVAARMDVPVETARSRVQRGVALLRERFEREHRGDRSAWLAAFLPLTILPPSDAGPVAGSTAAVAGWKAIAVGSVLAVAIGGGAIWFSRSAGHGSRETSGSTIASASPESITGPTSDSGLAGSGRPGLVAASVAPGAGAAKPMRSGRLVGRVTRDGPAGAVADARVVALHRTALRTDPDRLETTSDAEGRYAFADLPEGEVMVFAEAPGFATEGLAAATFEGYNPLATTVSSIEATVVDVVLVPAGDASGHVLDPDGRPLAGAVVSARLARSAPSVRQEPQSPLPPWKATTAEDGSFRFDALPPSGTYDFEAVAEGLHAGWLDGVEVSGLAARSIEIRIPASRWIEVQVLDGATEKPVADAEVNAGVIGADSTHVRWTRLHESDRTDADGRVHLGPFRLEDVEVRVAVDAHTPKPVAVVKQRVAREETATIVRIDRTATPAGYDMLYANLAEKGVKVHVVGPDDTPIPSVRFAIYNGFRKSGGGGGLGSGVATDGFANCGYSEPPAEFVEVYDACGADGAPLMLGAARVALEKGQREVSIRLGPGRSIAGRVTSPSGVPLSGVLVLARPDWLPADPSPLDRIVHATARTDARGAFRLAGLADTRYRLSLHVPQGLTADPSAVVAAGATDVVLTTRGSVRPTITVLDPTGTPVAEVIVGLLPPGTDPRDRSRLESYAKLPAEMTTDARGVAVLDSVDPAARFVLTLDPPKTRTNLRPESRDGWAPRDEIVTLGAERVLRGHVHDAAGRAVDGVAILWTTAAGGGRSTNAAADGSFVLRGVAKGSLILVPHWKEQPTTGRDAQATSFPEGADDVDLVFDPGLLLVVRIESPLSRIPWSKLLVEGGDSKDSNGVNVMNDASARADGKLRFRGLSRDRTYTLCISPVDGLSLIRGGVRADAGELTVRLEPGLELAGRVLLPDGATDVRVGFNDGRISANAEVAGDGRFVIRGVPAGSYDVTAWIRVDGAQRQASATIRAGESGDIDLRGR